MKPQKLTPKKVKSAARKAYKERRLTAQHRNQNKRQCVYSKGEYHCAIGWALNQKALKQVEKFDLNDSNPVLCLVNEDIIDINDDDLDIIEAIQMAHDEWATASRYNGAKSASAIKARDDFLAAIGLKQE